MHVFPKETPRHDTDIACSLRSWYIVCREMWYWLIPTLDMSSAWVFAEMTRLLLHCMPVHVLRGSLHPPWTPGKALGYFILQKSLDPGVLAKPQAAEPSRFRADGAAFSGPSFVLWVFVWYLLKPGVAMFSS